MVKCGIEFSPTPDGSVGVVGGENGSAFITYISHRPSVVLSQNIQNLVG